ncbi:MAG: glycosyltransferase family 4 protein [Acidobacteriia bacterium]|nr:glycosyltransferase family 4 protein [Terriglobia bacterium]
MRVLHLDSGREMRGGQWQVLRLLEGLRAAGIESVLLARTGSPLYRRVAENRWPVEPLNLAGVLRHAGRCDLIHPHDGRSHTLAAMACRTPLVVARRVAFPIGSRWKYQRAARYIAVSQYVKSILISGGVPEQSIAVVYDGVPLLPPANGSLALAPANTDDPHKGTALALESAALAGVPLRLTANLQQDLSEAGLFVYITHSEGLGSAALLAMSAAVPVVASDTGGLREVIAQGENGLLVENSLPAIVAALREIAQNSAFARQLGQAGRRTVEERFTTQRMVEQTIGVYRQVLS